MKQCSSSLIKRKELEEILNGIPEVIKVFNADHTIYFCNEAGYKFYHKFPEEADGEICYKLLNRSRRCKECCFNEVVKNKVMMKQERYIPELNKIMDVCYNPILDEDGEVKFVIEILGDITERKTLSKILKNDKEKYKQIINSSPDALMIIVDNKIDVVNNEALNLFQSERKNLINCNIYRYFNEKYSKILHKRFKKIIMEERTKDVYDCELNLDDDKVINVQLMCSYILYEGRPGILMTLRNTSVINKDLIRAGRLQRSSIQKDFPGQEYFKSETIYVPAYTVSGDFYSINKIDDELMIGILVDVKGKGISAALNISALELMFMEQIRTERDLKKIVENLNVKLGDYYEENYIAVCCFSLDFSKKEFRIVGAGINQFIFQKQGMDAEGISVEGPFLGMFSDSKFTERKFSIDKGDRIFIFSDGFDFVFDEDGVIKRYIKRTSIKEFKNYLEEYIEDIILEDGNLHDDCTMIAMEIK